MPLTKERREELLENCRESAYGNAKFGGTMLGCDELRALLDSDERLERVREIAAGLAPGEVPDFPQLAGFLEIYYELVEFNGTHGPACNRRF